MTQQSLYRLSDCTVIEPLVNSWPAWSFLVAPVPASLHLLQYQIPLLRSYIENPGVHVAACHDPAFAGGAFVDIPEHDVARVAALLEHTETALRHNLEFARDILSFQVMLNNLANGVGLDRYYPALPSSLQGYVELVYDYCHHPSLRFIENLLYESPYYDPTQQSLRISALDRDASRPFFLNTPRLAEDGAIDWRIPFAAPQTERLFGLDRHPAPLGAICELLGVPDSARQRLLPVLAADPPSTAPAWREHSVRARYFGHACVLFEHEGVSVLTDPCVGVTPAGGGLPRFSYQDLPHRIDYAVITHNHQDHNSLETLLRLRERIGCLVVPRSYGLLYGDISLRTLARKLGFRNVVELDTLDSIPCGSGEIVAIPFLGEHSDLAHGKSGYVLRMGGRQIFIGADSDCLDRRIYENVRKSLGRVDTVFIGTESVGAPLSWINGPLLPAKPTREQEETRRQHGCDARRAMDIVEALGASRLYNYAMGLEPWMEHILGLGMTESSPQWRESEKLLAEARQRGLLMAERLFGKAELILEPMDAAERSFTPSRASVAKTVDAGIGAGQEFVFDMS